MDQKGRDSFKAELRSGMPSRDHCANLLLSYRTAQAQRRPKQGPPPQQCSPPGVGPSSHWKASAPG